ncbi:unnamed protein product, partial [Mesorhabditis spiculigera]
MDSVRAFWKDFKMERPHDPLALAAFETSYRRRARVMANNFAVIFLHCAIGATINGVLFLTPGVRGYVQQMPMIRFLIYTSGVVIPILTGTSWTIEYRVGYMVWLLHTVLLVLVTTVVATDFDTEMPMVIMTGLSLFSLFFCLICAHRGWLFAKARWIVFTWIAWPFLIQFIQSSMLLYDSSWLISSVFGALATTYILYNVDDTTYESPFHTVAYLYCRIPWYFISKCSPFRA